LNQLFIDTAQSPTEIKNAVEKYASDFVSSASENDLKEIKILRKDGQTIGKKDFVTGFKLTMPDSVLQKLSEDYSVFLKKEGGVAKIGIVFKTVTSSGLADVMKSWEPTAVADLNPLYLGRKATPASIPTFNSSQYKNADIRYSNVSDSTGDSLDYTVISNFLIIGTSKNTTRAILDYMATK
jgi:hypothetical protein